MVGPMTNDKETRPRVWIDPCDCEQCKEHRSRRAEELKKQEAPIPWDLAEWKKFEEFEKAFLEDLSRRSGIPIEELTRAIPETPGKERP
jgi:hypothetical protein